MAALPALSLLPRRLLARGAPARRRRVRPGDPDWPDAAEWQRLRQAVGGNLFAGEALFAACVADAAGAACAAAKANITNPFYLGDQPCGTQVSGWLDAWTPAPSAYVIRARSAADVAAGVDFAREHGLRLVIKGTGHSYQGTSNAADSLLIWTRAMNAITLHEGFVPQGCAGDFAPEPAVSAEAGALWIDLYDAVTTRAGRYVQGGGCADVGVAGLVQSGGFGSFSKGFGTAAASLLEAELVTADGAVRVVNAKRDPDLFWAIKGGGGGSWGVITRVTLRTHPLPEYFGGVGGAIRARSDAAFRALVARFVAFYAERLHDPHWGEQVALGPDNTLRLGMVCQGLDAAQAERTWQPFFAWVQAAPAEFDIVEPLGTGVREARRWWAVAGNEFMIPDPRPDAPKTHGWWRGDQEQVGAFLHGFDSLWLPAALLRRAEQPRLVDALIAASRHQRVQLHFNKGLSGAPAEVVAAARATATNPAVCEAFALAILADGEGPAYPGLPRPAPDRERARRNARAIDRATAELRKVAPAGGSYVSESNYFNPSWQRAFWGEHYPRLRRIKDRYDPEGLFFVHHGVGSEDWSADGFARLSSREGRIPSP
jgi:FAD/FMN-containing dehydrogenase